LGFFLILLKKIEESRLTWGVGMPKIRGFSWYGFSHPIRFSASFKLELFCSSLRISSMIVSIPDFSPALAASIHIAPS
jgi:hypothetical protein